VEKRWLWELVAVVRGQEKKKKKKENPGRAGRQGGRERVGQNGGKKIEPQEDRKINVTVTPFIKNN